MIILSLACGLAVAGAVLAFYYAAQRSGKQTLPFAGSSEEAQHPRHLPARLVYLFATASLVAVCITLFWGVNGGESQPPRLPGGTVIVVDLSGSIGPVADRLISRALHGFAAYPPNRKAGLVYFSSTANVAS